MASKYWIKLYHETLYDRKIASLDDRLWRRFIECLLMAGELNEKGLLPPLEDMAWTLRADIEQLETELGELVRIRVLEIRNGRYTVSKFAKRQAPMKKSEYMRRLRDERQKQEHYQESYQPVTNSNADKDTDKDIDKDKEEEGAAVFSRIDPARILSDASGLPGFPGTQLEWIEVIYSMAEDYGVDKTTEVMRSACNRWKKTKGKNGRYYSVSNLSWINWALDELVTGHKVGEVPDPEEEWRKEWLEATKNE